MTQTADGFQAKVGNLVALLSAGATELGGDRAIDVRDSDERKRTSVPGCRGGGRGEASATVGRSRPRRN